MARRSDECCWRPSVANVEPSSIAAGLRPRDFDRFDVRVWLGRFVPFNAGLDSRTVPFEDGFDTSVGQVPTEPLKPKALRFLGAIRPEEDALDPTPKAQSPPSLIHPVD